MNNAATATHAAVTLPPALREVGPLVPLTREPRFLILPNCTNESTECKDPVTQDNMIEVSQTGPHEVIDQLLVLPGANVSTTESDFADILDEDKLVKQLAKRTPAGGATSDTGGKPTKPALPESENPPDNRLVSPISHDFSADPQSARPAVVTCSTITVAAREFGSGKIKMDNKNNYVSIVPTSESPADSAPPHSLASSVPGPSSAARGGAGPQLSAPSEPSELEPLAPPLLSRTGVVRMEPKLDMGWIQPMAQQQGDKSGISSSSRTPRATPRTTPRVTPRGNKVSPGITLLTDLLSRTQ